jgi:hypothetical protein
VSLMEEQSEFDQTMSPRFDQSAALENKKQPTIVQESHQSPWSKKSVSIPSSKPVLNLKVKKNINKTLVNSGVVSPLMDSTVFRPFDIISKSI